MKIEIAEPGKMAQTGSSLFRLIQNDSMPSLDLLVRESVQNSLDARKDGSKYVDVNFITGTFTGSKLASKLEGITDHLCRKYPGNSTFIAVGDSGTVGLTGETDYEKIKDEQYGNALKLIYEICMPQENEGAGGSWGIGKTVYFRIGIGLVIYYSRIKNNDGTYESRLAASFVEDEKSQDAMIPRYKGLAKRGIAWWGKPTGMENRTVPVTDDGEINELLSIFGIEPYIGDKTGTVIIIPYTDETKLLENNQTEYFNSLGESFLPRWCNSVEDYLRLSVQRWYAPRLSNIHYPYGTYLRAFFNGEGLPRDNMEPIFQIVQALYNRTNGVLDDEIPTMGSLDIKYDSVSTRGLLNDPCAGTVASVKVSRSQLKMNAPNNNPEPLVYMNKEITTEETNRPLVFFARKPGMIVSYESKSEWTPSNVTTNKNEYVFCMFTLNSVNTFKDNKSSVTNVEEYIRKGEKADHTTWNDWTPVIKPKLVSRIQVSVSKFISSNYMSDDQESQTKENSALSKLFGDLLLPPDGFGKSSSAAGGKNVNPKQPKEKKFTFKLINDGIKYRTDSIELPMELKTAKNKAIKHTSFEIVIDSEYGKIKMDEWTEKLLIETPFYIRQVNVNIDSIDGIKISKVFSVNSNRKCISESGFDFTLMTTKKGVCYGLDISSESEHEIKAELTTVVALTQKNVRPAFIFEKGV